MGATELNRFFIILNLQLTNTLSFSHGSEGANKKPPAGGFSIAAWSAAESTKARNAQS